MLWDKTTFMNKHNEIEPTEICPVCRKKITKHSDDEAENCMKELLIQIKREHREFEQEFRP